MDEYEPITGELRSYVRRATSTSDNCWWTATDTQNVRNLCDCIDSVHAQLEHDFDRLKAERDSMAAALDAAQGEHAYAPESHYMLLPKDADGVPIHVGDMVTCARSVWEVTGLRLTGLAWGVCCTIFNDHGGSGTNVYPPCDLRHYHAPTVEDVLTEFAAKLIERGGLTNGAAQTIAEYADKLRLVGEK